MFRKREFFILLIFVLIMGCISSVSANDLNLSGEGLVYLDNSIAVEDDSNEIIGNGIENSIQSNLDDNELSDDSIPISTNKPILKSNSSESENAIYFNESADEDGDGSLEHPYKYLDADRLSSEITAYISDGTYYLNSTCNITNAKITGLGGQVIIKSNNPNRYDFIINENSSLKLERLYFENFNILNHGSLEAKYVVFDGHDTFDLYNGPKVESGSGLSNSSFGGVILCDGSDNKKSSLYLFYCSFSNVYDAFNGGAIAVVNSNVSILHSSFKQYSSLYKGGAIYSLNSDLKINDTNFDPFINFDDGFASYRISNYSSYYGGSIYCENSNITFNRTKFLGSVSYSFGGAIASFNSNITAHWSEFNNSRSITDGGGVIYSSRGEFHTLGSVFNNNSAEFGGSICNLNSILDSYRCQFYNTYANSYGGVIYDMYGSLNLNGNRFGYTGALIGGSIYTRIPNNFDLYGNYFGDSYAKEGSSIFFDGKKENIDTGFFSGNYAINYDDLMVPLNATGLEMFNTYSNSYSFFLEFNATLNGENYSLLSNPLYYTASSVLNASSRFFYDWPCFNVSNNLLSLCIFDSEDTDSMEIITENIIRNVSANVQFSNQFENPSLTFYLYQHIDNSLYIGNTDVFDVDPIEDSWYSTSRRTKYLDPNSFVGAYKIDLSNKTLAGTNYTVNASCSLDFSNPFLSVKYDNLYEASSYAPVSLVNYLNSNSTLSNDSSNANPLSSYYNSDDLGLVSSIKNQGNGGNCWAFAGLATLEACLKKATGVDYDFSEENAKNLMAAYSVFGLKIDTNFGGYDSMLLSYLTSWLGPIDQSVEDYDDYSSISVQADPMFHIQNVKFIPPRLNSSDNDLFKMAIRDNGAVSVMLEWNGDYHAVSLVGWDDNFAGNDSLGNYAEGAWIFKNSFGDDWGYNGFGYLSYKQKLSEEIYPYMHAYTFIFSDTNPYAKVYQYDFAGVSEFYTIDGPVYYKNSFIADEDSLLSAFSTYFDRDTNFTVMVYKNGEFALSQEGFAQAGYYTIPFNEAIPLAKGDEFSVAVKNHNAGYNCIPACMADEINKKTFNSNVSFISYDGENWFDLYDYSDSCHIACIKAFTSNINLTSIKINASKFSSVKTKHASIDIYFDDFDSISSINYCLVTCVLNGKNYYAQIIDGKATLSMDLEEGLNNLSIQYNDNVYESNIIQFSFTVNADANNQSFNALQDLINDASDNSVIDLDKDYFYDENFDNEDYGVLVDKQLTINGNGHVIDGLSKSTGLFIRANNVVLNNITIKNTAANIGGALYIAARNVKLNNCSFINSSASQYGGAVYSLFDISLDCCRFINNSANTGGGLYFINDRTSHVMNSYFDNNSAETDGSAIYAVGDGKVDISSSFFMNNFARYNGGAVFFSVRLNNFTNCLFYNNSANSGGAVSSHSYLNEFNKCIFLNNFAVKGGGAVIAYNHINVFDSEFICNSVNLTDDFILDGFGGGAIYSFNDLNVSNSKFVNNSATNGGAIYACIYLKISKSNFTSNLANDSGAAVYNTPLVLIKNNYWAFKFTESYYYDSNFINNSARYGGAIYNADFLSNCNFIDNCAINLGGAIYDAKIINASAFINNSAFKGSALFSSTSNSLAINNSNFIKNYANYSGTVYSMGDLIISFSSFVNNNASYGGAISSFGNASVTSCIFSNNWVNATGGAIYSDANMSIADSGFYKNSALYGGAVYSNCNMSIVDSGFYKNSASFGGAIYLDEGDEGYMFSINLSSCNFTHNVVNRSGGAIYSESECFIEDSGFFDNFALVGAGVFSNANMSIANSSFANNSANFGGAIFSDSKSLKTLSDSNQSSETLPNITMYLDALPNVNLSYCDFEGNNVNISGGAIYSNANMSIAGSTFDLNSAKQASAIYAIYILNITNSTLRSNHNSTLIYFTYYHDDEDNPFGEVHIRGNVIDVDYGPAIFYNSDEKPYDLPLYLIFDNVSAVKGQEVALCHLEDSDGNSFSSWGVGNLTVLIKNPDSGDLLNLSLEFIDILGTSYLNTSSLDFGKYQVSGNLPENYTSNYAVKDGILKIVEKSVLSTTSGLTKVYGNNKKLVVTLKDGNGKAISNVYVSVKLNGKTTKLKTNSKGQISLAVKLVPNTYSAIISFAGNDNYLKSSIKAKVVIKKAKPKIIASKKTFKLKAKVKSYTITLKNNLGKVMKNTQVKITVGGKTYTAKTNSKGRAVFKLKLSKKGNYKATIKYLGSKYYYAVNKKLTLTVKK